MLNRVLTDADRELFKPTMEQMQRYWPEMYSRKIADSMVQFAFAYQTTKDLAIGKALDTFDDVKTECYSVLSAGSHEDIATECLKLDGFCVIGIDPVWNCDLHTFKLRCNEQFDFVVSASVLEHTTDDEEFIDDACKFLRPGGYGVFTMDFKNDWHQGQKVPYTSNRFYTTHDLTVRLNQVLAANNCSLVGEYDYSAQDRFIWDGINYSFATFVFRKNV